MSQAPPGSTWALLHESLGEGSDYYEQARTEIVDLVERPPARVLDLGCGAGVTGALLKKKHPGATVIGIEPDPGAAALAAGRLDRVIAAKLANVDFAREGIEAGSVDVIIAADVLEHMVDPWQALRTLRPLLSAGGAFIASLPNVRNLALLGRLADGGRWRYASSGLLDVTHLRFFTRHEMHALFVESGYQVHNTYIKLDPELESLYEANKDKSPVSLARGRLRLENISNAELKELCTLQFILVAGLAA